MVVYNVVDMKRRGSPAIKYGSSGSVTETGAQQGKSSSTVTIRQTEENGQEKSSGKASVEVSGINNRMATELDGADTVFADGSISALSVERKITPETSKEARYEILKDRTIHPASVEYDKLGDTDTAAIYDGLSAAQMAQVKKAIRAIEKKLGLHQVDLKNSRIKFPFRFSNANASVSAQHQSEYGGLYMTVAMTKKGIRRRKKAPSRRKRRGHFSAIGFQHQHTGYLPKCQGRRGTISEVCTGRLSERCAECRKTESDSTSNGGARFVQD